ncbi:MAG TPA: GntR family transcriptional regulator [Gemmatimonadaceae bacterium]|jgi:DNA-binding GntR family transcriptional regulator|nr:GntR family transcriptional regulator [Gemmatimonadaceae bacterium]
MPRRTRTPAQPSKDEARHSDLVLLPLRRQTLTGMTADAIRERILRGHYAEGSPLRQDAIGAELGVSRIPVREALRQLEAEGLVTFNPHRGAVVSTLSLKQIAELYELRADVESDLIRRAVPNLTAEDDARAAEILDAYEAALHAGQVGVWGALNWKFHSTLYAPADRELTMSIVSKLHHQSDRYSRMQLWLTHGESRARHEHRAIAVAAKKRDAAKAAHLMRDHILTAGRALVTFLEKERAQGDDGVRLQKKNRV